MGDILIDAMSNEKLLALKEEHSNNESIAKMVDGILETRVKEQAQVKAKDDFGKGIEKLIAKLPVPPDGVYNVYARYAEVEEQDTTQEGELVEIEGQEPEVRYPMVKGRKWIVEVNKALQVGRTSTTIDGVKVASSKRGITVERRNDNQIELVGNFPTATKACEHLDLHQGADSATRFLQREGYLVSAYTGTEYTS